MAPKRFKKSDTNQENGEKYKNLIINDVLCPICRSIFIEPVTLPCNHGFCLACFNSTMENTTLTCPLCRVRIGSWLRSARKEKKIINGVLWRIIQLKFSKEIRNKLEGDDITPEEKISIKLADPGEIRREYEVELAKEKSEIQRQHDSEIKASEIIIKKILEEEQNAAKNEAEKLRLDEEVARRLAAEQEKAGPSFCQSQTTPKSSKKSSIDRYLTALSKKKQDRNEPKIKIETVVTSSKNEDKNKLKVFSTAKPTVKSQLITPTKSSARSNNSIICPKLGTPKHSKTYQQLLLTKSFNYDLTDGNGCESGDSSMDRYLATLSKKKQESDESKIKIETVVSSSKNVNNTKLKVSSIVKPTGKPELSTPTKASVKNNRENNTSVLCPKLGAQQQCSKAYQHLLLTKTLHYDRADSNGSDSGDSIKPEMRYFKPIRLAPTADLRGDANLSSPLLKITPMVAQSTSSVIIRSPQRNYLVRIGTHPGSAFVCCSPETNEHPLKIKQPSVVSDSGRLVKQYYNRKRNTLHNTLQPYTVTSPVTSPCMGFKIQSEQKYVTIMRDLVSTMSEQVNSSCIVHNLDSTNVLKKVTGYSLAESSSINKQNFKRKFQLSGTKGVKLSPRKSLELSPKKCLELSPKKCLELSPKKFIELTPKKRSIVTPRKLNGCDGIKIVDTLSTEENLQEKLDLEYAKRLHEELNNPRNRHTRASIQPKISAVKTRTSPRKRQLTLDELVTPKKFKI